MALYQSLSIDPTDLLCDTIRRADGRTDPMKSKLIQAVRVAINREDAIIAVRMALTYDWRRKEWTWYGNYFDLTKIDYGRIVDKNWNMWRRLAPKYATTYVRYTVKVEDYVGAGRVIIPNWTFMNIFVGDTYERVYRRSFTPPKPYETSKTFEFIEDRTAVWNWIRKYQRISSKDAKITVNIYGTYGNAYRNMSGQFFEYENSSS